ncbi:hypothetical protein LCGC14_2025560 [marine sediment metagenome]|uniref:Uncharacterized protein n=1 Tax=marine sediment metagenome TaxID=412755 RepID=A0A0F9EWF3_9ZZZZ
MAFTYDITTNRGKVRLLISDTDSTDYQFEDDEIDAFLTMASGSLLLAASYALESWAATLTNDYDAEKIGDYSYTNKKAANKTALAKKYREEDATSPYLTWSEMDLSGVEDTTVSEDVE